MHSPGMDASKSPDPIELGFSAPRASRKSPAKAARQAFPEKTFAKAVTQALHKKSAPSPKPRQDSRAEIRRESQSPIRPESPSHDDKEIQRPVKPRMTPAEKPAGSGNREVTDRLPSRASVPDKQASCHQDQGIPGNGMPATPWASTVASELRSESQDSPGMAWENIPAEIHGEAMPRTATDPNAPDVDPVLNIPAEAMGNPAEAVSLSPALPAGEAEFAASGFSGTNATNETGIPAAFPSLQNKLGGLVENGAKNKEEIKLQEGNEGDEAIPTESRRFPSSRENAGLGLDPRMLSQENIRMLSQSPSGQRGWNEMDGHAESALSGPETSSPATAFAQATAIAASEKEIARNLGQAHAGPASNHGMPIPRPGQDLASQNHPGMADKPILGLPDTGEMPLLFSKAPSTMTAPGMHPDALRLWHTQRPAEEELSLDLEWESQAGEIEVPSNEGMKPSALQTGFPGRDGNSGMTDGNSRQGQGQMGLNPGAAFQDKWQTVIGDASTAPIFAAETPSLPGRNHGVLETRLHEMHALLRREIDSKAASLLQKGSEEIHMQLMPEHLGKVRIALELREGTVNAHIQVQSEAARQSVDQSLQQLRDSLGQHGFKIENLSVSVEDKHAGLFNPDGSDGRKFFRGQGSGSQDQDGGEAGQETDTATKTVRYLGYNTLEYVG